MLRIQKLTRLVNLKGYSRKCIKQEGGYLRQVRRDMQSVARNSAFI